MNLLAPALCALALVACGGSTASTSAPAAKTTDAATVTTIVPATDVQVCLDASLDSWRQTWMLTALADWSAATVNEVHQVTYTTIVDACPVVAPVGTISVFVSAKPSPEDDVLADGTPSYVTGTTVQPTVDHGATVTLFPHTLTLDWTFEIGVMTHELGHAFGLQHDTTDALTVMAPVIDGPGASLTIQPCDVAQFALVTGDRS